MSNRKINYMGWGLIVFIITGYIAVNLAQSYVLAQEPPTIIVSAYQIAPNDPLPSHVASLAVDAVNDALALDKFMESKDGVPVANCIVWLKPVENIGNDLAPQSEIESANCGFTLEQMNTFITSSTWVRIDYTGTYRTGNQLIQATSNVAGCSDGSSYVLPDYSTLGWSNITSSTESNASKGCGRTTSYDFSWYSGSQLTSTPYTASMGAMDNDTESSRTTK